MPRVDTSYVLSHTAPHTQLSTGGGNTVQSLVLDPRVSAVILSGSGTGTNIAYVTFDNSTPASTNGICVLAAAQPVLIPLGYYAHNSHTIKVIGSAATTILNVLQME